VAGGLLVINNLQKLGRRDTTVRDGQTPSRHEKKELSANGEHCRNTEPERKLQPMSTELAKTRPDKHERIRKRLKYALDAMIWGGPDGTLVDYVAAAKLANISTRVMRKNLEKPQVLAYLRSQREVFRASLSTKTLWHLDQISSQRVNMNAAVAACRAVLGQDEQSRPITSVSPRLTIVIRPADPSPTPVTIEAKPLDELGTDPHDPTRELAPARFHDPNDPDR